MIRTGILTSREIAGLLDYDRDIVQLLKERGIIAEPLVWEDCGEVLPEYDYYIMRTCWGYHQNIEEFLGFLDKLEKQGGKLYNSPSIIRHNSHKFYLRDLENDGANIIPTIFLEANTRASISEIMSVKGWERAIIKPAISASANNTIIAGEGTPDKAQEFLEERLRLGDTLVQKFMPEITDTGEWSTIYFANGYHYTVRKKPKNGDFRVQSLYGGIYTVEEPPASVKAASREIADRFINECLYMRIDGVASGNEFYLMELELIEPDLYMNFVPESKIQFVESFLKKIQE